MKNQDVSADGRIMGPCRECGHRGSGQDTIAGKSICTISGRDVSRLTGGCPVFKKRIKPAEEYNCFCGLESFPCQYKRPVAAQEDKYAHEEKCRIDRSEKGIVTMIDSGGEKIFSVPSWWSDEQVWTLWDATNKGYEKGLVIGGLRKENEIKKSLGIKS